MGGVVVIRGAAQMFVPFVQDVPPDVCAVVFIRAGYARRAFAPDVRAPDVRAVCSRRVVVQDDGLRRMFADCAVCVLYHVHAFAPYVRAVCVAPDVCAVCFECSTPMN